MIRPWEKKVTPHNKKGRKSSRQMEQTREKEKRQERKRNRTLLVVMVHTVQSHGSLPNLKSRVVKITQVVVQHLDQRC